VRIRREQRNFHRGMTGRKPDKIGARITTGADNSDLDHLPSRVRRHGSCPLALRKLEAAARFCLAVLLAFDDARIASEEAFFLKDGTKGRLVISQGL
jgi:hypothetical protein